MVLLGHMVGVCLTLLETVKLFFKMAVPFLHLHQQCMSDVTIFWGKNFLHIPYTGRQKAVPPGLGRGNLETI